MSSLPSACCLKNKIKVTLNAIITNKSKSEIRSNTNTLLYTIYPTKTQTTNNNAVNASKTPQFLMDSLDLGKKDINYVIYFLINY
ncbi:hypothetical protein GCM10022291_02630 [Postechiella marina]|uniref:Uncharacterized protein n=1 Tax=Postechiella marina TaxID=943941 RepID=A0ABP8BZJ2_9FLAO